MLLIWLNADFPFLIFVHTIRSGPYCPLTSYTRNHTNQTVPVNMQIIRNHFWGHIFYHPDRFRITTFQKQCKVTIDERGNVVRMFSRFLGSRTIISLYRSVCECWGKQLLCFAVTGISYCWPLLHETSLLEQLLLVPLLNSHCMFLYSLALITLGIINTPAV